MSNYFNKVVFVPEIIDSALLAKAHNSGLVVGVDLAGSWSDDKDHIEIPVYTNLATSEPIDGVNKDDVINVSSKVFATGNKQEMIEALNSVRALCNDELEHGYRFISKITEKGVMSDISYKDTVFDENGNAVLEKNEQIIGCWYGLLKNMVMDTITSDIERYHGSFNYYITIVELKSGNLIEVDQLGIDINKVNERLAQMIDKYVESTGKAVA